MRSGLDKRLDLYAIKAQFEYLNGIVDLTSVATDLGFLNRVRRAVLPLPIIDRQEPIDPSDVFEPLRKRPIPEFEGKRVALVASGGGGAAVSLIGVARAFEEAGIEPAEIVGCSGGALWGSMWAAGMTSDEMAEFSLSWTPEDYLDIQWTKLPKFALSALRGFTGLAKGEAIERLFDARLADMLSRDTPIPLTSIVYNMDLGRIEYFGTTRTPEVTVAHMVRCAIALPLFIEAVEVRGHLYVDGGVIESWPAGPVIEDGGFDHAFGLNLMLPPGFEPKDITGWRDRVGGVFEASRQLNQGYHLELAQRSKQELGDRLTLLEPVDPSELYGTSFFDLFIDRRHWPRLMRQGYEHTTRVLDEFRNGTRTLGGEPAQTSAAA
jgi:NTE family protein